jgi:UDP-N-acetylglucosamine 4,6-dehydratase
MDTLLITGGSGYLGRSLAQHFQGTYKVVICSRNQKALGVAGKEIGVEFAPLDVTNYQQTYELFLRYKPNVVIHAAATKFVDISEKFPTECIDVNINGSRNVALASIATGVQHVVGISTDKAAAPIENIYGLSKAVMEKTFQTLNNFHVTNFSCVRYGNVVWSTGSVFPIWKKMLSESGIITSTGANLSRFFFKVDDAVKLIATALQNESRVAGNILSIPMKGVTMKRILDIWTSETGMKWEAGTPRPGDRSEEFLIAENEISRTREVILNDSSFYLIESWPEKNYSELVAPVSSSSVEQMSDKEIFELVFKSEPESER